MLFSICRVTLRHILGFFVRITLKKHQPIVILIKGEKNSAIITEFFYKASLERYNPRKTLERTESEFAIPLTILGYLYYPQNLFEWLKVISRLGIQTFWIAPYKHMLLIQTREITPSIYKYWLKTIKPSLVINTEEFSEDDIQVIQNLKIPDRAISILNRLKISLAEAQKNLDEEQLNPSPRINLYTLNTNQIIVDARYFYYPPSLQSVIEATNAFMMPKLLVTTQKLSVEDINFLKKEQVEISANMPKQLHSEMLLIIYDSKKHFNSEIDLLLNA